MRSSSVATSTWSALLAAACSTTRWISVRPPRSSSGLPGSRVEA